MIWAIPNEIRVLFSFDKAMFVLYVILLWGVATSGTCATGVITSRMYEFGRRLWWWHGY